MKAVGYKAAGSLDRADALLDIEIEKPVATGRDILVRVQAVSVNPVDYKIRQNRPPEGDAPAILGWDAVGKIVEAGEDTSLFKVGDEVWYAGAINRSVMFTRPLFQTPDMIRQHELLNEVADLLDAGKIKSTATDILGKIDAVTIRKAHAILETNKAKGKLVLEGF